MGDMADDLTENGLLKYELHISGQVELDCPYCMQEEIFDEE